MCIYYISRRVELKSANNEKQNLTPVLFVSAHKFFGRHSALFKSDRDNQSVLDQLSKLYSKADLISCKEVQTFK